MTADASAQPEPRVPFPEIAAELVAIGDVDQAMRTQWMKDGTWDEGIDKKHAARLKEIIAEIGWPTISKVGKKAAFSAFLVVQHAGFDVAFQEECVELMKQAPEGEVVPQNIAMLSDRINVFRNRPQTYGTQFHEVDGVFVPFPLQDEARVDEFRARVGLGSLEEYAAFIRKNHVPPKQG
jgi:hypothetical protein